MRFYLEDIVNVDGDKYRIVGKIKYKNNSDGMCWDEYRMFPLSGFSEAWLSIDDVYKEYSISRRAALSTSTADYHLVDKGTEIVVSREGNVDVDVGDRAIFEEYEDVTEEKIISREVWDDETEICTGYYLDEDEISLLSSNTQYGMRSNIPASYGSSATIRRSGKNKAVVIMVIAIALFMFLPHILKMFRSTQTIQKYLDKSNKYSYVTSITGESGQKAKVYKASQGYTVGDAARGIIDAIEGETEKVQQDTTEDNGSIGILTKDEYCLIYLSEDGDVLVQVSNRKYAYTTDSQPYHSSKRVHSYYRRFYYSGGYIHDKREYKDSSPYSSYDGDMMTFSSDDYYSSYSKSVRQDSVHSRSSSGGGLSSGK